MRRVLALALAVVALGVLPIPGSAHARPRSAKKAAKTRRSKVPSVKLKAAEAAEPAQASAAPPSRGPTRIDFDDRLIQGQTNKSGAVYLYDRKELKVRSMVRQRDSFREAIVSSVFDG